MSHIGGLPQKFDELGRQRYRATQMAALAQYDELGAAQLAFDEMAAEIADLVGALNKQRKFAESLIHHAPAGIVVHRRGEIVFGNPELCRILNIDDIDEIPGRDILYLFHRDDREEARAITVEVDERRVQKAPDELRTSGCYEEPCTVEVVSVPIEYEDQPAVLTVLRDITERKFMEAKMMQMDRAIAIGTLVAGVGHEINNPLSFILGNVDFLSRSLGKLEQCSRELPREHAERYQNILLPLQDALNDVRLGRDFRHR